MKLKILSLLLTLLLSTYTNSIEVTTGNLLPNAGDGVDWNSSSTDMIKLASLIEGTDDIRATLKQLMWSNCKACHSKYRMPH